MDDLSIIDKPTSVKGIGTWTAKMYLLFVLCREDILPYEDSAFLQAYQWLYKTDDIRQDAVQKMCKMESSFIVCSSLFIQSS